MLSKQMFENVRNNFPVFEKNPELIFLDTAASALKPKSVIERINSCYSYEYTNIHRGVYKLSTDLTVGSKLSTKFSYFTSW